LESWKSRVETVENAMITGAAYRMDVKPSYLRGLIWDSSWICPALVPHRPRCCLSAGEPAHDCTFSSRRQNHNDLFSQLLFALECTPTRPNRNLVTPQNIYITQPTQSFPHSHSFLPTMTNSGPMCCPYPRLECALQSYSLLPPSPSLPPQPTPMP